MTHENTYHDDNVKAKEFFMCFYVNCMNKHVGITLSVFLLVLYTAGADPGFVVRRGVSRRGVWGPLKVPSGSKAEPWQGTRGAKPPGSSGV